MFNYYYVARTHTHLSPLYLSLSHSLTPRTVRIVQLEGNEKGELEIERKNQNVRRLK
jgi:hypothetical protein